jgi:hypothetical protein
VIATFNEFVFVDAFSFVGLEKLLNFVSAEGDKTNKIEVVVDVELISLSH